MMERTGVFLGGVIMRGVRRHRAQKVRSRGVAIAQTAIIAGTLGLGVAAMAIDTGLMFNARSEMQTSADAAALAAAAELVGPNPDTNARQVAYQFAEKNKVAWDGATIDPNADVDVGRAVVNGEGKYEFVNASEPYNAVRVRVRRDANAADGPVSLAFAKSFGAGEAEITAEATAMLVPRDISVVIDLSGSMNDDSELRHAFDYVSDHDGTTRNGIAVNLKDIWIALPKEKGNNGVGNGIDPAPPGNPTNLNDQPGTGPGSPNSKGGNPDPGAEPSGGSSNPSGPRWGWMTGWGTVLNTSDYNPTTDFGLYYIPRNATTTDADVVANITEAGYNAEERAALLSGAFDGNSTFYYNRLRCLLGLAGWKSKKANSKYNGGPGNGDNKVDNNELTGQCAWPFTTGNFGSYFSYVASNTSEMYDTNNAFRYRFGIKTVVNYLQEIQEKYSQTPELAATPAEPLESVKWAVEAMSNVILDLESDDRTSLAVFGQTGRLEFPLSEHHGNMQARLRQMQAGHYDGYTNIGGGLHVGLTELLGANGRSYASKVIVLLTDGKPNCDSTAAFVGNGDSRAVNWAMDRAQYAADQGIRIYTVAVGQDADRDVTQDVAEVGHGEEFFASGTPENYSQELTEIFQNLGGKRPVQLIK